MPPGCNRSGSARPTARCRSAGCAARDSPVCVRCSGPHGDATGAPTPLRPRWWTTCSTVTSTVAPCCCTTRTARRRTSAGSRRSARCRRSRRRSTGDRCGSVRWESTASPDPIRPRRSSPVAYVFALSAGLCYAMASVFQHRVAAAAPKDLSLSPRLILVLFRHPMWLFGIALDIGAYFLEALALANGSIVLVQTLLVSGLLFALPLSAIGRTDRPGRKEWFAAAAVAGGIAVFLAVGDPNDGHGHATALDWVIAFSIAGSIIAAMVIATRKAPPHYRALGLAVATGACYAVTAALTKQVVTIIDHHGPEGLFMHWPVYALAVFSIAGLILNQSAFNAGELA